MEPPSAATSLIAAVNSFGGVRFSGRVHPGFRLHEPAPPNPRPSSTNRPGWVHQCKLDGYRFLVVKHGNRVRCFRASNSRMTVLLIKRGDAGLCAKPICT